jgi:hypothetical protein
MPSIRSITIAAAMQWDHQPQERPPLVIKSMGRTLYSHEAADLNAGIGARNLNKPGAKSAAGLHALDG